MRNKIEGAKANILTLVEEGKQVKEGDLLIEFDSSDFEDQELAPGEDYAKSWVNGQPSFIDETISMIQQETMVFQKHPVNTLLF